MGKTISIANQKGGVGKTTTSVNLAASLGAAGYHILLVDIDPQGNSTSGLGVNKRDLQYSTYHLLVTDTPAEEILIHTEFKNVKAGLCRLKQNYDFLLIDCPPSLGIITLNAFVASDTLMIPIQCEYYALEGLSQLMSTLRQVKRRYNPEIEIEGVLLTMYDSRLNLTMQVAEELKKYFPQKVYATVIPRNVRLSEAPSFGQPILYYDRGSRGNIAYEALTKEFLSKNRASLAVAGSR